MRCSAVQVVAVLFILKATAGADTFTFDTDPFAGSTALTTPGRQVVGGEPFISFNPAVDVFEFALSAFGPYGVGPDIDFVNDVVGNLPTSGVNAIVLRTFDNDANPMTPFGAGNAASLIAAQLTSPGPGFFIYFNQGLNLPRLVFSTNLDDDTADLKILARMTNLLGAPDALADFTSANFVTAPEPSGILLITLAGACWARRHSARRKRAVQG